MKRSFLDRFIGFFSPETERKRIQSRLKSNLLLRSYDAAQTFSTDDWTSATKGSANAEIRGAQGTLRDKGSDAVRNNSYANRAVAAITSNTVGTGIVPHIKGKSRGHTKKLAEAWKEWGETSLCDLNGKNNFSSMQALIMRSVVERGEVLVLKEVTKSGHKLQLLESDFIVSNIDQGAGIIGKPEQGVIQGVRVDTDGKVISYILYESHPGDSIASTKYREVPANKVCHVYRQDRPGQLRGISWFAPVIRLLEDLAQYQQATLIGRKIAACFSAFITTDGSAETMSASAVIEKRELDNMLTPGTVRYLSNGESVTFGSPPKIDGYQEYVNQMLRSIASGLGVSYEALTSDYSQVNYSSGRMAHLEFRKNVEHWRWAILIPQFCEPAFKHFLDWCTIVKGINTDGVTCDWVPPSWSMLDPSKEISAMKEAIRSGLISYPKAIRELGYEPEDTLREIADNNKTIDDLKLVLDSDPRKTTAAGLLQMEPNSNPAIGENPSVQQDDKTEDSERVS